MPSAIALFFDVYADEVRVYGSRSSSVLDLQQVGYFHPNWETVTANLRHMGALLTAGTNNGALGAHDCDELRRLGMWLFDELLPFQVREWFDAPAGTLLTISIPTSLNHIPWECLHSGSSFLGTHFAMSRLLRSASPNSAIVDSNNAVPVTSALIIADPADSLDAAYTEGIAVREIFTAHDDIDTELRAVSVDPDFLIRNLRERSILHFAGHIDERGWQLDGEHLRAEDILRLSGSHSMPRLIFANGCRAVDSETDHAPLLEAWLQTGIQHYLGPQQAVPDRLARPYAIEFYKALLDGFSIAESVRLARVATAEAYGEGTIAWGAYVLYGPPGTVYTTAARQTRETNLAFVPERSRRDASTVLEKNPRIALSPEIVRSNAQLVKDSGSPLFQSITVALLVVIFALLLAILHAVSSPEQVSRAFSFEKTVEATE